MGENYYYEFEYDSYYCYQGSNILKNKLKINEPNILADAERKYTAVRTAELLKNYIPVEYDEECIKEIHRWIFQDIYEWAGEYRKVDIAKGNMFCRSQLISEQLEDLLGKLKKEHYLNGFEKEQLSKHLAHYLGDLNAIHPFREGNGRTQRIFIQLLARKNGYDIDYSKISKDEMLEASKRSFNLDYELMEEIIYYALEKIEL